MASVLLFGNSLQNGPARPKITLGHALDVSDVLDVSNVLNLHKLLASAIENGAAG